MDPTCLTSEESLPPPLIPLPKRRDSDCEPAEEESGTEAPPPPQDLGDNLSLVVGELELAAEAYSEMGGTPVEEETHSDVELEDRGMAMTISRRCPFSLAGWKLNLAVPVSVSSVLSGAVSCLPPRNTGAPRRAGFTL